MEEKRDLMLGNGTEMDVRSGRGAGKETRGAKRCCKSDGRDTVRKSTKESCNIQTFDKFVLMGNKGRKTTDNKVDESNNVQLVVSLLRAFLREPSPDPLGQRIDGVRILAVCVCLIVLFFFFVAAANTRLYA
jgi:hypothetical protein